jgi:hypothetical protein
MRENKYDIRRFNFTQVATVIQMIAQYQKQDLHVFFKYILSCLEQDFFPKKVIRENFQSYTHLFHLFVKEGFISHS